MRGSGSTPGAPRFYLGLQRAFSAAASPFSAAIAYFHNFSGRIPVVKNDNVSVAVEIIEGDLDEAHNLALIGEDSMALPGPSAALIKTLSSSKRTRDEVVVLDGANLAEAEADLPLKKHIIIDDGEGSLTRTKGSPLAPRTPPPAVFGSVQLLEQGGTPEQVVPPRRAPPALEMLGALKCQLPVDATVGACEVHAGSLQSLEPGAWVNDEVINYYLRHIDACALSAARSCGLLCMNSHFYTKLTEGWDAQPGSTVDEQVERARRAHGLVRGWTKRESSLSYEFILVPVHAANHWSLAVICNPEALLPAGVVPSGHLPENTTAAPAMPRNADLKGPDWQPLRATGQALIIHLDSQLGAHDTRRIGQHLAEWLWLETRRLHPECGAVELPAVLRRVRAVPVRAATQRRLLERRGEGGRRSSSSSVACGCVQVTSVLQQQNASDCGLFMLAFAEFFAAAPPVVQICPDGDACTDFRAVHEESVLRECPSAWHFFKQDWFPAAFPGAMRHHIRCLALQHMIEQADRQPMSEAEKAACVSAALEILEYQGQGVLAGYQPPRYA